MYSRSDSISSVQQYTYTNTITVLGSPRARSDTVCKIFYDQQRVRLSEPLVSSRQVHTVKNEVPQGRSTSASSHLRAAVSLWPYTNPLVFTEAGVPKALCGTSRWFDHKRRGPAPPSSPRLPGPRMHTPPVDRCWTDESLQCSLRRPVTASTGCPAPRAPHGTRGVLPEGLWTRCAQTCVGDR